MLLSFVPLAVGGCKQFTSCKRSGEPVRQRARKLSEGVYLKHPFQMQKTKALNWLFQRVSEEWKSRVQRPADSYIFWGVDAREIPGGTPETWTRLAFCQASYHMTLSRAGFLTLAPGKPLLAQLGEKSKQQGSLTPAKVKWINKIIICTNF